jgi:hypothetical protein
MLGFSFSSAKNLSRVAVGSTSAPSQHSVNAGVFSHRMTEAWSFDVPEQKSLKA